MGVTSTRIGPSNRLTGRSGGWTPALLSPTLWFDASSLTSGATTWTNQGTGGSVLNGTFGATTAAPRVLPHTGTNYLYLPGTANNGATAPNVVAYTPAVSLQIDWDFTPFDLSVAEQSLVTHFGIAGNRGWRLSLGTTAFALVWSTDGGDVNVQSQAVSFATMGVAVGVRSRGRVILRYNSGGGNYDVRWYTVDAVGTATLVETDNGVGTTSIFASTQQMEVGSRTGLSAPINAAIYRTIVVSDGTVVFDADFTTGITSGGQTGIFDSSSNNAAVTINRSASGYKATAVVRPTLLFGGGQHIQVADNALVNFGFNDPYSIVVVTRSWPTISTNQRIVAKNDVGTGAFWRFYIDATSKMPMFSTSDGTTASGSFAATVAQGASRLSVIGVTHTGTSPVYQQFGNGTFAVTVGDTATGGLSNSSPMIIGGSSPTPGSWFEGEILAVLLIRRVLTAAEIQQVSDYYTYEDALAYTVGTLTTVSGYNILTFNGSGTFTPGRNLPVEYLVVAGGGGGGGNLGGGGGAGGLLSNVGGTKLVMPKTQQTVTVGAGGAGSTGNAAAGTASSIGNLVTADGGGRGSTTSSVGGNGGSGGGAGRGPSLPLAGGVGIVGQGFNGGASSTGTGAGGGGGASQNGFAGAPSVGGNGGNGVANAISGTSVVYAGGGGGGGGVTPGTGGTGGGGNATVSTTATAGTANTGGGGGGASTVTGAQGGSGVVIIRWPA